MRRAHPRHRAGLEDQAENFHFPACNYDQNDIKVSVRLQCNISTKETSKYAREMYLDCIYLRPRISKAE